MKDELLLRYNRQIMLPQIDIAGQQALCNAHVMIVGLGGLGSPAAMYLASAGVGKISLVDFDYVDLTNLQRQIVHPNKNLNRTKVDSARETLLALNPEIEIYAYSQKFSETNMSQHLDDVDVLLDCSDNFSTRQILNKLALQKKKCLVSGAAIGIEGQISVFDFRREDSACYQCIYSEEGNQNFSCTENGVLGPLVGIIGSMQALETIKLICNFGNSLHNQLLIFDGSNVEWRKLRLKRDPECPACQNRTQEVNQHVSS